MRLLTVLAGLCCCLGTPLLLEAQSLSGDSMLQSFYSVEKIRGFADYLRGQEDFLRAAAEYDRLHYLIGASDRSDSVLFYAGWCYLRGGNATLGGERMRQLRETYAGSSLVHAAAYYTAKAAYTQERWPEAVDMLSAEGACSDSIHRELGTCDLFCLSLARLSRWSEAETAACSGQGLAINAEGADDPCTFVLRGKSLPLKHKWKAGLLSAIVPGLGKFYTHRKADGIFAFVSVGTSAWQSISGFHKEGNKSVRGWVYGILSVGFYLGNVYGATVSVEIYNGKLKENFFRAWESRLRP